MYPGITRWFNYHLILSTYSFCQVLSISPCDLRGESKNVLVMNRPSLQETVTTAVDVSLFINDVNIIDIKRPDLEIDLVMTEKWYDHRLSPDYKTKKLAVLGAIWQPKITFVVGNKICPDNLAGNDQTQFWRGTSNGSVFYSERFIIKPKCTADLRRYPFDSQTCSIKIGSYRFTSDEVSLTWSIVRPVKFRGENELGEFSLKKFHSYNEVEIRSAGNFSVLVLEIHMTRYCNREVLQSFAPSFVLVKMSYGILWTKPSDIRTRIFTCQLSLLGILFLFTNSNHGINPTYFKAIDIWFLMCFFFALIPLAESIIAFRYFDSSDYNIDTVTTRSAEIECTDKKWAMWIDKVSRILHPVLMLASTTLFFTIFSLSDE